MHPTTRILMKTKTLKPPRMSRYLKLAMKLRPLKPEGASTLIAADHCK